MKNLKKLSRNELKNLKGGGGESPISDGPAGCSEGYGCACGAIYNDLTPGTPHWDCCSCPK